MPHHTSYHKYGGWLPTSHEIHQSFIKKHLKTANEAILRDGPTKHIPAVEEFKIAIEGDAAMKDMFDQIFLQVSDFSRQVKNFETLLSLLDCILPKGPPFHLDTDAEGNIVGEPIGVPIYLIFDLLSNTAAAYDLFRLPRFNVALKKVLDSWGSFLSDPERDSNAVLNTGPEGWFGQTGVTTLEEKIHPLNFNDTYTIPDPNADHRGFKTWDAFFTRTLKEGARPVDFRDQKFLIHSACESTVYRVAKNVKAHDQFWLKSQKYSLYDMLDRDEENAAYFAGGTVYQAFLSPLDYHRWHAPIDGTIEKFEVIDGSFFAVMPDEGAAADDPDLPEGSPHGAIIRSQSSLTINATRALIYIKADNPDIGRICFIGVGMLEVSTCDVTVKKGQHVSTGDELGLFHFGGSSHALIFESKCQVTFADVIKEGNHIWVNSVIGRVDGK
ncbi:phosphatidylserine decarboxylase [Athelia psychrophila]|uniref:Phosphatidylserine decarboxylase n=1 Tax=Athelia psychrophila TaxID=1759441 RepID=A0A166S598_9AGAM|nr:phosphatidylserine decarboxylase [Fibularhizoctonia sp. CBS 109695]